MARRVNTAFVVSLGGALSLVTVVILGTLLYRRHRAADPVVLQATADQALTRGDLKTAIDAYARAADATSRRHGAGADELFAKMAKLSMEYSKSAKTEQDAVMYYQRAVAGYDRAAIENPRNSNVNEILLEEKYQWAMFYGVATAWSQLEEVATRMIGSQALSAKPYTYRAVAQMRQIQSIAARDLPVSRYEEIQKNLDKALELDPKSGQAFALKSEIQWAVARSKANKDSRVNLQSLREDAKYAEEMTRIQTQLADFLNKNGMDKDVALAWMQISLEKYNFLEADSPLRPELLDGVIAQLEKAVAANKGESGITQALARLFIVTGHQDKAEQLFKELIAQRPQNSEGYVILAGFYRNVNRTKDAIAAYKDVLAHTQVSGGLDALRNSSWELEAEDAVAWLNLDLAEAEIAKGKPGQEFFTESAAYTDKLRTANAPKGMIDLLDGRTQFLNRNLPDAAAKLHAAESGLKSAQGMNDRLRQTKILLARTNRQQNQLGAALGYVNDALELDPGDIMMVLERGDLLIQLARFPEAKRSMEELLRNKALTPTAVSIANRVLADAESRLGNMPGAQQLLQGDPGAVLQLARTNLDSGDNEGAAVEAMNFLEKEAQNRDGDNLHAFQIAVFANVRLDRKEAAIKILDRALNRFPQNTSFRILKAQLLDPNAKLADVQRQAIEAISDEFQKQMELASYFNQQRQPDDELKALQAAEKSLGDALTPAEREKLGEVVDRAFSAALSATGNAKSGPTEKYWSIAEGYMQRAERLNLDGVNGKLFRGRFLVMQSQGKKGVDLLEQAVAQRPDYAMGHLLLGQVYYSLGNLNFALEEFRQVLRLAPNNLAALQRAIELLVRKSDSASMKEAQGFLETGLVISPRNPVFVDYNDILAADKAVAIRRRELMLAQAPEDMNNARRLAGLYVRNGNPDKAIAIIKPFVEKSSNDLELANMLASLYGEAALLPLPEDNRQRQEDNRQRQEDNRQRQEENRQRQIDEGLKLYEPFVNSSDLAVKYESLLDVSEFFKRIGRFDRAVDMLTEAMRIQPEGKDHAQRHLGDIYFDQNDMVNAEKTYLSIVEKSPPGPLRDRLVRRLIEVQIRLNKYDIAGNAERPLKRNSMLEDLLKRLPDDPEGLILHASSCIEQKQLAPALADLSRVIKADPNNVDAYYYRALAQATIAGDMDAAIKDLVASRTRDRTSLNGRMLLARLYKQSTGGGESPRYGEAALEYADIVEMRPDLPLIRLEYANFLMELAVAQQSQSSESDAEFAVNIRRVNPAEKLLKVLTDGQNLYKSDPIWPLMYTDLLSLQGNIQRAQTFYKELYNAVPGDRRIVDSYLGSLLKTKNYEEVITIASPLITANPGIIELRLKRAAAYQAIKKESEAGADIDAAFALASEAATKDKDFAPFVTAMTHSSLVLAPDKLAERLKQRHGVMADDVITSVALVHTLMVSGHPDEAAKVADSIHIPPNNDQMKALVLRETSLARYQAKQFAAAEKEFKELLAISPEDVESLNNFAFMLADGLKRPKDAFPYLDRIFGILSSRSNIAQVATVSANVYDTLGWAKHLDGDDEAAVKALRKSIGTHPAAEVYLHLATTYKKMKRTPEARKAVQDGLNMADSGKEAGIIKDLEAMKKELEGM